MQILIILCIFSISITLCSRGFVKIKGQFLCNGLPWKNEKVAIYEANYVLPDTMFAMNLTDSDGNFNLEASGKDIYPIRPYIYLPNYCNAAQVLIFFENTQNLSNIFPVSEQRVGGLLAHSNSRFLY